jgi:hypothetical protein
VERGKKQFLIMTPKEKANELVTIFLNITKRKLDEKGNYYDMDLAIECALATANQATHITGAKYWYNVKQEIQKL